jgi:hypothetical protein
MALETDQRSVINQLSQRASGKSQGRYLSVLPGSLNMRTLVRRVVPMSVRNWLRRPDASLRFAGYQVASLLGLSRTIEVTESWRVRCHPATAVTFEALRDRVDCRNELTLFLNTVAACPEPLLVDVGSHFGAFT